MEAAGVIVLTLVFFLLIFGAVVGSSIFFALAVYNDAKARWNPNAVLWAVLTGVFGSLFGLIYLFVRNEPLKRFYTCHSCGWGNPLSSPRCGHCGAELYYPNQESARLQNRAKNFLIAALALFGGALLLVLLFLGIIVAVALGEVY